MLCASKNQFAKLMKRNTQSNQYVRTCMVAAKM